MFTIWMGVPEIKALWEELLAGQRQGLLTKDEEEFFQKWVKTVNFLATNPRHPSLHTHEIDELSRKFGDKVFEAYLENNTPGARRLFWVYGPKAKEITILAVESHPNNVKKHAYHRIKLADFPKQ